MAVEISIDLIPHNSPSCYTTISVLLVFDALKLHGTQVRVSIQFFLSLNHGCR